MHYACVKLPKIFFKIKTKNHSQRVVADAFNPSPREAESGKSLRGQPGLQSKFQDNQGCYSEKLCLNKQTNISQQVLSLKVKTVQFSP